MTKCCRERELRPGESTDHLAAYDNSKKIYFLSILMQRKENLSFQGFLFLSDAILVLTEPCSILHGWIAVCFLGSNS